MNTAFDWPDGALYELLRQDEPVHTALDGPYRKGSVQCEYCVHHYRGSYRCDAFPDLIPPDIWDDKVQHFQPYPGDHGIQFQGLTDDELKQRFREAKLGVDTVYRRVLAEGKPLPESIIRKLRASGEIE